MAVIFFIWRFNTSQTGGFHFTLNVDQYQASQIVNLKIVVFESVPELAFFKVLLHLMQKIQVQLHLSHLQAAFLPSIFNNFKGK